MLPFKIKIEWKTSAKKWTNIPRFGRRIFILAIALSLFVHLLSYLRLTVAEQETSNLAQQLQSPIKISIKDVTQKKDEKDRENSSKASRILETPLEETKPPKEAKHLGAQDHATDRETKAKDMSISKLDPGLQGVSKSTPKAQDSPQELKGHKSKSEQKAFELRASESGTLEFGTTNKHKPRNRYEQLLPSNENDLPGQITAGYQDQLDEDLIAAERIDMNTSNYRFISYFTNFRKQIDLVWVYPVEAIRRGIQGEVQLEIIIEKSGHVRRIRVLRSSGHAILDDATVATVKMASPFSPLPAGMGKDRLVVVGTFRYMLTAYVGRW